MITDLYSSESPVHRQPIAAADDPAVTAKAKGRRRNVLAKRLLQASCRSSYRITSGTNTNAMKRCRAFVRTDSEDA